MTRLQQWMIVLIAGSAATAGGYVLGRHEHPKPPTTAVGSLSFRLEDLTGRSRTLQDWKGRTVLINFWATWCPPCRQEIPLLIKSQERDRARGLAVVGIAVDRPSAVRAFSKQMHINYTVLLGQAQAFDLMAAAGDSQGLLPYSVLLGADGRVLATQVGAFDAATLARDLKQALPAH